MFPVRGFAQESVDVWAKLSEVSEQEIYTEGYFRYLIREDGVKILSYFGKEKEVTIPDHLAGMPVTGLDSGIFRGNATVETVTIPDTVTGMSEDTFADAARLQNVINQSEKLALYVPEGVNVIEDYPVYIKMPEDAKKDETEESGAGIVEGDLVAETNNQSTSTSGTAMTTSYDRESAQGNTAQSAIDVESTDSTLVRPVRVTWSLSELPEKDQEDIPGETISFEEVYEYEAEEVPDGEGIQQGGIPLDEETWIRVDDTGNLVAVRNGDVTVIDSVQKYSVEKVQVNGEESYEIKDQNGAVVSVDDEKKTVEYVAYVDTGVEVGDLNAGEDGSSRGDESYREDTGIKVNDAAVAGAGIGIRAFLLLLAAAIIVLAAGIVLAARRIHAGRKKQA